MAFDHALVKYYAPVFRFHENEPYFPCSIEYLLKGGILHREDGTTIASPSQLALADGRPDGGIGRYVDVNESQYHGENWPNGPIACPLYYSVQEYADANVINYIVLFAHQGAQTCRVITDPFGFNTLVPQFGEHQGDLERVSVVLDPTDNSVLAVQFEAHGDISTYGRDCVTWIEGENQTGWHPLVHVALTGHSMRNLAFENSPIVEADLLIAEVVSECGNGLDWKPWVSSPFRQLLAPGEPLGSELWAGFAGRLGKKQTNVATSGTRFDGGPLEGWQEEIVKDIEGAAEKFGLLDKWKEGDGPVGPLDRPWLRKPVPSARFDTSLIVEQWIDPSFNEGRDGAFVTGRFHSSDKDSFIQFWSNHGDLGAIAYKFESKEKLVIVSASTDLGQKSAAIDWLTGRFLATDTITTTQVIQLWDNHRALGMIVYGVGKDSQQLGAVWGSADVLQGLDGALGFFVGKFANDDSFDRVLHVWDKAGKLGLVLYGQDGQGGLKFTWSQDTDADSDAVKFVAGRFGTGASLLQLRDRAGKLGMVLWGRDGAGGLAKNWSTEDVAGAGPVALEWLVGDFNGDGFAELLQCRQNGSQLGMTLIGADGKGGMRVLWSADDMGQGWGAFEWSVGDYDGDGKDEVLQCWRTSESQLGLILYHFDGTGMTARWGTANAGQGANGVGWLTGRFVGDKREQLLQLYADEKILQAVRYGTPVIG